MSRVISQVELGSSVWLRENDTDTEYILTRKDQNGCELLRKYCVSQKRMHSSNVSVYDGCEADQWLTNSETGFLSRFSETLQSNLVNRSISTFTYGDEESHYISRKCYLYSYGDLFMSTPSALYPTVNIILALMLNKNVLDANSARIARNPANTENVRWWLRSASSATNFWNVVDTGTSYNISASSTVYWMRPVLNVSPDTIVSDEGANIIYLLPEEKPRVVEYKGRIGVASAFPTYGCVKVDTSNLTNTVIKVTNNWGDGVPVWQTVQNDVQFQFANTEKQTENWELGIWFYGETPNLIDGYSEQPQLLII